MVQLSHPYVTRGKTIALTIWTFVGKVMSLLFNKLSRFVTTFLPRSKSLLILWLQSLSAVILESKKIKHLRMAKIKKKKNRTIPSADEDVEKQELSGVGGGDEKQHSHVGKPAIS